MSWSRSSRLSWKLRKKGLVGAVGDLEGSSGLYHLYRKREGLDQDAMGWVPLYPGNRQILCPHL